MSLTSKVASHSDISTLPEDYYRLLIENITDYAVFMLDPTGHIISWNAGAALIKQYAPSEIIGQHFSVFYTQADKDRDYPATELREALKHGRYEDEGWRVRKDGTLFWANVIITPVYDRSKKHIGFSKVTRNFSEKKKAEEKLYKTYQELKESEERFRLLLEGVRDYAIIMLDPAGNIASWNEGARRMKGYEEEEIIGKHFSVFYAKEAVESGFPAFELKTALANGRFEDEGWRYRKDGSAFWANTVLTPIYNTENRLLGYTKITRDLTERRRNEELMRRNKELVRINNELDSFVYIVSHDLKSPIVNLEGLLLALEEDMGAESEKHGELLTMMEGAVSTLKNVINDLTEVSNVQQDKQGAEEVHIPTLIDEVKESIGDAIRVQNASIKTEFSDFNIIYYKRKNLRSIIHNLLTNALKYADPRREPEITIRTYLAETGECVLSVSDNGLGIPESNRKKIFGMFKRAHDHVAGSGVGLYLVKKILDNTGDRITVASKEGEGSVFKVFMKAKSREEW